MNHALKLLLALVVFAAATSGVRAEADEAYFARLDALAPEERFRQLSLMLMISDGADEALIETLSNEVGAESAQDDQPGDPEFDFDEYTTPLIRIVDQETMLGGATRLFRFTRNHAAGIGARIRQLREDFPEAARAASGSTLIEDAIIIRNAIADSIDYTLAARHGATTDSGLSAEYRARTLHLRNNLEYEMFATELDRITAEAVASVGGQSDAYERMFDDEVDGDALNKKIDAAEYVYGWDRDFDERAAKLAEEILKNIWDREVQIDP
jgi:hypothetical protein